MAKSAINLQTACLILLLALTNLKRSRLERIPFIDVILISKGYNYLSMVQGVFLTPVNTAQKFT